MAQKLLALFGSTYMSEQAFSAMNINKARLAYGQLIIHLRSVLRIATTQLNFKVNELGRKLSNCPFMNWNGNKYKVKRHFVCFILASYSHSIAFLSSSDPSRKFKFFACSLICLRSHALN